ncbi:DUF3012 domain-containing protein [Mariprofundus ferrooxydans]|nr:DUF3012 domain-containing protein [Mariprofundus ferrooxydans]
MKKNYRNGIGIAMFALLSAFALSACSPEPGSKAWCDNMQDKAKGEWTAEQAGTFTKHCVLGNYKK